MGVVLPHNKLMQKCGLLSLKSLVLAFKPSNTLSRNPQRGRDWQILSTISNALLCNQVCLPNALDSIKSLAHGRSSNHIVAGCTQ